MTTQVRANQPSCRAGHAMHDRAQPGPRRPLATRSAGVWMAAVIGASAAAPVARSAEPLLFQAGTGYICPHASPLQEHLNGTRSADDGPPECLPGLDSLARVQIVALDAENHPFVWVCTAFIERQQPARPPFFVCGYTLAQWIVGIDLQPIPKAVLQAAARRSTMADVRRTGLP